MSKAFITSLDSEDDDDSFVESAPITGKNYMTPAGYAALQEELKTLMRDERPKVVEIVSWAAGNGDRSENGDYIYGKKRLREIDRRIHYLSKRLKTAEVVDPRLQKNRSQVFFGATVTYLREDGTEKTVTLVGVDEANLTNGKISWISPMAKALLKSRIGDVVYVRTPSGRDEIEVISIEYQSASE